jgi:hypothetical protein
MTEFRYGPVDLFLVGFDGERPDPGTIAAVAELVEAGTVRLLDYTVISRNDAGEVSVREAAAAEHGLAVPMQAVAITTTENIEQLADTIPPGGTAVLIALELAWSKRLSERFAESGAVLLAHERIPAPVVNAIADLADST